MKIDGGLVREDKLTESTPNIYSTKKKQDGAGYPKDTLLSPFVVCIHESFTTATQRIVNARAAKRHGVEAPFRATQTSQTLQEVILENVGA
jgi:hypothetical protein